MIDETLLSSSPGPEIDIFKIERGNLMHAKHRSWNEFRNGVVTTVRKDVVWAYYWTGYGNVTNHYRVTAEEVENGEWEIYWTDDFETIYHMTPANGTEDGQT